MPKDKYEVVAVLQSQGKVVGMTGDGVNDAPALAKAQIGIAVAGATDAAQAASDIVLTKEGLSPIFTAIVQSRKIFKRLKAYVIYRICVTVQVSKQQQQQHLPTPPPPPHSSALPFHAVPLFRSSPSSASSRSSTTRPSRRSTLSYSRSSTTSPS